MARCWGYRRAELSSKTALANLQRIFATLREREWCGSRSDLDNLNVSAGFGAYENSRVLAQLTSISLIEVTRAKRSVVLPPTRYTSLEHLL